MKRHRALEFLGYGSAALGLGFINLSSIGAGIWGVKIHSLLYVGLFFSIGLLVSAFIAIFAPKTGRGLAVISLTGMGVVWIPGASSLIPAHDIFVRPFGYVVFAGYLAVVAFALFYPMRWRYSLLAYGLVIILAIVFAGATFTKRYLSGEYAYPAIVHFLWIPAPADSLVIIHDKEGVMDAELQKYLSSNGIYGTLKWQGGSGGTNAGHKVYVLMQEQLPEAKRLPFPREGNIIYAFDGAKWITLPSDAKTYPRFATLEPENSKTMLMEESINGGRQVGEAFRWPAR
ncbi:MAG: hypothetical protein ABIP97_01555 [Chthoniobacterales bacterium]